MPKWNLYLSDDDRSTGWTNHCFVLQYVGQGEGDTPQQAWDQLKASGGVAEGYLLDEPPNYAIPAEHEHEVALA